MQDFDLTVHAHVGYSAVFAKKLTNVKEATRILRLLILARVHTLLGDEIDNILLVITPETVEHRVLTQPHSIDVHFQAHISHPRLIIQRLMFVQEAEIILRLLMSQFLHDLLDGDVTINLRISVPEPAKQ
jgi:hypothetical protein